MKKTLLILWIISSLIIAGMTTVNAATTTAELKASSTNVKKDDTFTITLNINCESGINAVLGNDESNGFKLNFDTTKLSLVKREALGSLMDLNSLVTNDDGTPITDSISLMGTGNSGDVYQWTFKVIGTGNTEISITPITIIDFDDNEYTVTPDSINVQISEDSTGGNTTGGNTSSGNTISGNTSSGNTTGGNTTGGNIAGGNTSSKIETTSGKSIDNTTSPKTLPKTGLFLVRGLIFISLGALAVYSYKKVKLYKGL